MPNNIIMADKATGEWTTAGIATNTEPKGDLVVQSENIGAYAFAYKTGITSITLPNMNRYDQYPFVGCAEITSLSAVALKNAERSKFGVGLTGLRTIKLPNLESINGDQFLDGTMLQTLVLPSFTGGLYKNSLLKNRILKAVDLNACTSIGSGAFSQNSIFDTLIIRSGTPPTVAIGAFIYTPFASDGSGGTLYVPATQIANYQADTNWATLLGYSGNAIVALEGSVYENAYADGTPISGGG